ncbi:hypothetical protein NT05HA_1626 [Aggregatibacter aphrophilus NJ8700]|nr:hypothetical protein NT05HA_1626 [Aggregatibacter aphrophilus NJ8700]
MAILPARNQQDVAFVLNFGDFDLAGFWKKRNKNRPHFY